MVAAVFIAGIIYIRAGPKAKRYSGDDAPRFSSHLGPNAIALALRCDGRWRDDPTADGCAVMLGIPTYWRVIDLLMAESGITGCIKPSGHGVRKIDTFRLLSHSRIMNIALDRDVEEFLREQVEGGVCPSASKLVNDVLRSIREHQQKPLEITPELESWLLEAADQPVTPLMKGDFEAIRSRVLQRTRSATA